MQYRRLGRAGIKVSGVSLGGWLTFGEQVDVDATGRIVAAALDQGINFFDLADVYARGEAERVFGRALAGQRRQDMVISSKAFWPMSDSPNDRGLSRKHLFESIEGSLRRLGTDYLDIYFCHRHDPEVELDEIVRAMDDLITQGKVLYWGTSVWPASLLSEAVLVARGLGAHPPRAEQPRYNMLDRHVEPEILLTAARNGIGVVVWSPLAQGALTGKYAQGIPAGSRADHFDWVRRGLGEKEVKVAARLQPIADEVGLTVSQLALAWILRRPEVSSVITGASRPEQVVENAVAAEIVLEAAIIEQIDGVLGNRPADLPN